MPRIPTNSSIKQKADSIKSSFNDNRRTLAFLGIGSILTILGIVLQCVAPFPVSLVGKISIAIGVPLTVIGVGMVIYKRCTNKPVDKSQENLQSV